MHSYIEQVRCVIYELSKSEGSQRWLDIYSGIKFDNHLIAHLVDSNGYG
jgi:hypothetical protein